MKHNGKRYERGQSLVELAISLPIIILILGGIFDIGRGLLILIAVENAAGEGAIYGSTHPECLTTDHAAAICQGPESVVGRVQEEGRPLITMDANNSVVTVTIRDGAAITAGSVLVVHVRYSYVPLTPIGHLLWGDVANVEAVAQQEILSPPPPGYTY